MDHGDPRSRPDHYDERRQAHYDRVARQIAVDYPMRVENLVEPLVIVPLYRWSRITEKGLRFPALHPQTEVFECLIMP